MAALASIENFRNDPTPRHPSYSNAAMPLHRPAHVHWHRHLLGTMNRTPLHRSNNSPEESHSSIVPLGSISSSLWLGENYPQLLDARMKSLLAMYVIGVCVACEASIGIVSARACQIMTETKRGKDE